MKAPDIQYCPGTLSPGYHTYSTTCLKRMFNGKKVNHALPYVSPASNDDMDERFRENQKHISISGVQIKFSVILDKNKLRLTNQGEQGTYILKPIPMGVKLADQMPANEHLTMQIARQVYDIETAENALIFFADGQPAYITRRFDVTPQGGKWAMDDFASLAGKMPQIHGKNYKYHGNYLELFDLMKKYMPLYRLEAPKLFTRILFNYIYSNGDAHFKNFSLFETPQGDYRLSPAYDLLNSRMHIEDKDFALEKGLLPKHLAHGKIMEQFCVLGEHAEINQKTINGVFHNLLSKEEKVLKLINASFLNESSKRNYLQAYQTRLHKLNRP